MSDSSRLEVSRLPVTVVPIFGGGFEANLFLRPAGAQGRMLETLADRLEEPGVRFLPVEIEGAIEFLQVASIAYVEHEGALPEMSRLADMGAWRESVEITLSNGNELSGDLVYLMPPERRRISDLLNDGGRFVFLVDDTHARYVARNAIERVRPAASESD